MNIRCCALALLLLSGSVVAADGPFTAVSPVGLWLITLGITFLIAEAALPNYGVIGLGGIVMFVIGALILSNAELPVPMMIGLGLVSALLLIALLIRALKTRPRQPVSGDAGLLARHLLRKYAGQMGSAVKGLSDDATAAIDAILDGMRWLGLDWDGEVIYQFARADRHADVARAMIDKGAAYRCYLTQDELAQMRA